MRRTRPHAGVTLIELLVVLAIVALLASLTGGAVQRVRQAGQRLERQNWLNHRKNGETLRRSTAIRVLFIGNSYTGVNDLPGAVKALADADPGGPGLVVDSHTAGGVRLKNHWDDGTAPAKVRDGDWDFVVLQEQSQTPLVFYGRNEFYVPYARKFGELIRERKAIPMLYLTWNRPDTPLFGQREWTTSVTDLARDMKCEVAAAGIAKEIVESQIPGFNFYADSGGHPTPAGTYLVACTFFAAVFDKSPEGLPASAGSTGVPASQAPLVQKAAFEAQQRVKKLLDRDPGKAHLK